jgi:hypothetical protein
VQKGGPNFDKDDEDEDDEDYEIAKSWTSGHMNLISLHCGNKASEQILAENLNQNFSVTLDQREEIS